VTDSPRGPDDLDAFAAAVAHDLRTPLSAIAGEIEIALDRDRSAAEYRQALQRIAGDVADLLELSSDLALFTDGTAATETSAPVARLDAIVSALADRFRGHQDVRLPGNIDGDVRVAGDESRLTRAVVLVLQHALRHRQGRAILSLRCDAAASGSVRLLLTADAPGFWPRAWQSLAGDAARGPLRLRTARRILEEHGARLGTAQVPEAAVTIELAVRA
jgi:signal transduction histidine kinase